MKWFKYLYIKVYNMKWFKLSDFPPKQTTLIAEYTYDRSPVPENAHKSQLTDHRKYQKWHWEFHKDIIKCPSCKDELYIEHGDRLLCKCGTIIEVYGNSMNHWESGVSEEDLAFTKYPQARASDINASIYTRLTRDTKIKDMAARHPAISDAIKELELLISLHDGLDNT
jgi:hypothetical protein